MQLLFDDGVSPFFVAPDVWEPEAILGSAITNWWNADDTNLMADSGGGYITSWTDRVAGAAVTATGSARPLYDATGFNSLPGLSFNGTTQCFVSTDLSTMPTGSTAGEIWSVCRQDYINTDSPDGVLVDYGTSGGGATDREVLRIRASNQSALRISNGTGGGSVSFPVAIYQFNSYSIVRGRWSGTTEAISALGHAETTTAITTLATGTSRFRIGANNSATASSFWKGAARHVMLITGNLTDAQADGLFRWFAWDSGILSSLVLSNKTRP